MTKSIRLNTGADIPRIGFGTWRLAEGPDTVRAIKDALVAGYRLIDTAAVYENERSVGAAIRDSGIPREEIFVTTKLWNSDQGHDRALRAIDDSLERLGLDYVDLYLVHWPMANDVWEGEPHRDLRRETWRAMEEILRSGKARAIGVSNYTIAHLKEMEAYAEVAPAVNQVEFHPFLYQKDLLEYCSKRHIIIEAYSPLAQGERIADPRISAIAKRVGRTNAQVMLRWSIQHGCIPIPKSSDRDRIRENFDVSGFELDKADMAALDALNENLHLTWDPSLIP